MKKKILTFLVTQAAWLVLGYLIFGNEDEEDKPTPQKPKRKKAKRPARKKVAATGNAA